MSKTIKCPLCRSEVYQKSVSYNSGETDLSGVEIVISDVKVNYCKNTNCEHSWLPSAEEERIELTVLQRSRKFLEPEQIGLIREALGYPTKTAAANFLTLNSKAFTKWENGYTSPNTANDLLMRMAVFSDANFNFIKDLHAKKFVFDPLDYELICKARGQEWKYRTITVTNIPVERAFNSPSILVSNTDLYSNSKINKDTVASEFSDGNSGKAA